MARMKQPKFIQISPNEIKFEAKGYTFLLVEQNRGVYSLGRAVQLYQLDGLDKKHIKELAWTRSDNHGGMEKSDAHYKSRLTTLDGCKSIAQEYLEKLL